jgi:hypothetical protein
MRPSSTCRHDPTACTRTHALRDKHPRVVDEQARARLRAHHALSVKAERGLVLEEKVEVTARFELDA